MGECPRSNSLGAPNGPRTADKYPGLRVYRLTGGFRARRLAAVNCPQRPSIVHSYSLAPVEISAFLSWYMFILLQPHRILT